jgi:hypothetical protein
MHSNQRDKFPAPTRDNRKYVRKHDHKTYYYYPACVRKCEQEMRPLRCVTQDKTGPVINYRYSGLEKPVTEFYVTFVPQGIYTCEKCSVLRSPVSRQRQGQQNPFHKIILGVQESANNACANAVAGLEHHVPFLVESVRISALSGASDGLTLSRLRPDESFALRNCVCLTLQSSTTRTG